MRFLTAMLLTLSLPATAFGQQQGESISIPVHHVSIAAESPGDTTELLGSSITSGMSAPVEAGVSSISFLSVFIGAVGGAVIGGVVGAHDNAPDAHFPFDVQAIALGAALGGLAGAVFDLVR